LTSTSRPPGASSRALQEERLPILPRLLGEGGEVATRGTDRLNVGGQIDGLAAQPVHGGGGEPQVEGARGHQRAIERGGGGQDIDVVDRVEIGRGRGQAVDELEEAVIIVARLVGVDHQ
jgi:hypothetical protein